MTRPSLHCLSPFAAFIIGSAIFYLLILCMVQPWSSRDPTSWFFNAETAYKPQYSALRHQQSEAFLDHVVNSDGAQIKFNPNQGSDALCVGIPTVARRSARYFRTAVGSLLEGLSEQERQRIYLVPFFANSDPSVHPAYGEIWLEGLSDQVLIYNQTERDIYDHVVSMEGYDREFREKPLHDYVHLLKTCLSIGAPYLVMLEDDIIAMDGWYHRTRTAIETAEEQTALRYGNDRFLYLRLFYTEKFHGWNSEDWQIYLGRSLLILFTLATALVLTRCFIPSTRKYLRNDVVLTIAFVHLPLAIILWFSAGRMVVWPLSQGVIEMNNFGCCSQGFVFQRQMAEELVTYYSEKRIGFVDMLTEEYGDRTGLPRWAMNPSVFQHVGASTSKLETEVPGKDHVRTVAETLWNFAFERNDARTLREEHERHIKKMLTGSELSPALSISKQHQRPGTQPDRKNMRNEVTV